MKSMPNIPKRKMRWRNNRKPWHFTASMVSVRWVAVCRCWFRCRYSWRCSSSCQTLLNCASRVSYGLPTCLPTMTSFIGAPLFLCWAITWVCSVCCSALLTSWTQCTPWSNKTPASSKCRVWNWWCISCLWCLSLFSTATLPVWTIITSSPVW